MGYWLINTAGIGSIIVLVVGLSVLIAYLSMVRWIQTVPPDPIPTSPEPDPQASLKPVTATETGGEQA